MLDSPAVVAPPRPASLEDPDVPVVPEWVDSVVEAVEPVVEAAPRDVLDCDVVAPSAELDGPGSPEPPESVLAVDDVLAPEGDSVLDRPEVEVAPADDEAPDREDDPSREDERFGELLRPEDRFVRFDRPESAADERGDEVASRDDVASEADPVPVALPAPSGADEASMCEKTESDGSESKFRSTYVRWPTRS